MNVLLRVLVTLVFVQFVPISAAPTNAPSEQPSISAVPSVDPTAFPSNEPSVTPTGGSERPSATPTTAQPTGASQRPSATPTTAQPTVGSERPSATPTTAQPTGGSGWPSATPTTAQPTGGSERPSATPTTAQPTPAPTSTPAFDTTNGASIFCPPGSSCSVDPNQPSSETSNSTGTEYDIGNCTGTGCTTTCDPLCSCTNTDGSACATATLAPTFSPTTFVPSPAPTPAPTPAGGLRCKNILTTTGKGERLFLIDLKDGKANEKGKGFNKTPINSITYCKKCSDSGKTYALLTKKNKMKVSTLKVKKAKFLPKKQKVIKDEDKNKLKDLVGLAVVNDPNNADQFVVSYQGGTKRIVRIDPQNGQSVKLSTCSVSGLIDLASDQKSGDLWGTDGTNLFSINAFTGYTENNGAIEFPNLGKNLPVTGIMQKPGGNGEIYVITNEGINTRIFELASTTKGNVAAVHEVTSDLNEVDDTPAFGGTFYCS